MPPPVVLHVAQPTDGGVARCVAAAAEDQAERGWQVTVACPPIGVLADGLREGGHEVAAWSASRAPGPATVDEARRLRAIVGEARPDVVHLHSSKAGLAGRLVLRGRRVTLFQPHGWSFAASSGGVASLAVRWERRGARWTDRLVCVSEQERADGEAAGIDARWAVVPNGVDTSYYRPAAAARRLQCRQELGVAADAPVAVTVGRLVPAKGQRALVGLWPEVRRVVPGALLLVVGDGPGRRGLAAMRVDGVRVLGGASDVRPHLAAADVYVHPSESEAMSLAVLEAMASGLPVVATDVGGAREAVGAAAGAVVPLGDGPALVAAVATRLSSAPGAAVEGAAARERAVSHFDRRTALDALAALTLEVADR